MATTTFSGPVVSTGGFTGDLTGDVTGNVTGNVTGDISGDINPDEPINYSLATGITAFATGGQGSATALTKEFNNVTTCATDGDSVALPAAVAGLQITVKNSGAASCAIFPASGDAINAMAANLSVNCPVGATMTFTAIDGTTWETGESFVSTAPSTQKGEFVFKAVDNDGDTVTTLSNAAMGQASVISIPDPGAATANIMLTDAANDGVVVNATANEIDNVCDVSARVQTLTVSGAVTAGVQSIELNHVSTVIAATIADLANHPGFLMVKNISASGTAAHTVTASAGTWNGTNTVVTLNAPNEAILVYIDSAGNGTIIENVGTVGLS